MKTKHFPAYCRHRSRVYSCSPCRQVYFLAKIIRVWPMTKIGVSILKTISFALCDL